MKTFVVFFAVVGCTVAAPGVLVGAPQLALTRTVVAAPQLTLARSVVAAPAATIVAAPAVTSTQYHAQDELGQVSYGYAGGPSSKAEVRTADGITRGGYNYVDANGIVQSVSYVSDPVNGFRVAATNLPVAPKAIEAPKLVGPAPVQETPEVAAARAAHQEALAKAAAAAAAAPENPEPASAPAPAPQPLAAPAPAVIAPLPVQETPEVAAARAAHQEAHARAAAAAAAAPENPVPTVNQVLISAPSQLLLSAPSLLRL